MRCRCAYSLSLYVDQFKHGTWICFQSESSGAITGFFDPGHRAITSAPAAGLVLQENFGLITDGDYSEPLDPRTARHLDLTSMPDPSTPCGVDDGDTFRQFFIPQSHFLF
jgi:hypothetical protein